MIRFAELAVEAGLPEGVLNVVPGFGETAGQALGRHMDVDAIAFTGSGEVGKLFLKYAGESNMKRVSLERGGKKPNIIMADSPDLEELGSASCRDRVCQHTPISGIAVPYKTNKGKPVLPIIYHTTIYDLSLTNTSSNYYTINSLL